MTPRRRGPPSGSNMLLALKEAARSRFELGDYAASEAQFLETLAVTHQIEPGPSAWDIAPLAQMAGVQAVLLKLDDAERNFRASWALSQKFNGETHNDRHCCIEEFCTPRRDDTMPRRRR
jgi:hypothetical protein